MRKFTAPFLLVLSLLLCCSSIVQASDRSVMLYSSMKESQLSALKKAFTAAHPDIAMDYYTAGTGKVLTKLAAELQSGSIGADLVWVGDPTGFVNLRASGALLPYVSPYADKVPASLRDEDNLFCAARMITIGFIYNTNLVKPEDVPQDWNDLLKPRFRDVVAVTDPTFSGTALDTFATLTQNPKYGWKYLKDLKGNGARVERGASGTVGKVAAGEYDVCVGVDYIARTKMAKGSTIGFTYPKGGTAIIASPMAIMKGSKHIDEAKVLYDFILSEEGQSLLVKKGVIPVRPDMAAEDGMTVDKALKMALPLDFGQLATGKNDLLARFDGIMKK